MASFMRTPTQPKAFDRMPNEFHLRGDLAGRHAGMLRPIPDHDTAVGAHCRYDVRVLWLVASLVDLALVINLLHNVELHFHGWGLLARSSTMAPNFFRLFIVIRDVWGDRFRELYMSNLQIILGFVGGVSTNKQPMSAIILVWDAEYISTGKLSFYIASSRLLVR